MKAIARNYKKNPHTATALKNFHFANGADLPAQVLEDGTKLDSDGNIWVPKAEREEQEALSFISTYIEPERPVQARSARPVAGYLVEFQGHSVRCGDGFITEAQAKWIVDILTKREVPSADSTFIRLEQGLAKKAGSDFITANKNAPLKPVTPVAKPNYVANAATPAPAESDEVPAGRYALRGEDGVVKFYRLDKPTQGKWAGWTFLKAQASDDFYPIRNKAEKARIIAAIAEDVLAARKLYGQELGVCGDFGRTLTSEYRKIGIGPICINK